jgi:hypothetical protein
MNEKDHLEDQVAKTSAVAAAVHAKIAGLEIHVADWTKVAATAAQLREQHALPGLTGDASAAAATKKAIADQREAEQNLETLALAIPPARVQLAEAERAAQGARSALAKFQSDIKKRERIDVSAEIDAVMAGDLAKLWGRYEALGREILNMPDAVPMSSSFGKLNHEGIMGLRRVAAASPKFMISWFPRALHDEMKKESLATSEARFWNLPIEQPADKDKAA